MTDFLKNIRAGHNPSRQRQSGKKQSGITRKNYDAHNYSSQERRNPTDRRTIISRFNKDADSLPPSIKDSMPFIKEHISQIASSMEKIAEIKEILSKEQIKEYREIGKFFENLNTILVKKIIPALDKPMDLKQEKNGVKKKFKSVSLGDHNTKEEVLSIIKTMRKNGATFVAIANYLKEQDIPTFSGRGEWHAQTIHRLYR